MAEENKITQATVHALDVHDSGVHMCCQQCCPTVSEINRHFSHSARTHGQGNNREAAAGVPSLPQLAAGQKLRL